MSLVEEAATYLDGSGRAEAKALPRQAAVLYSTESMRLTTRLMQLASWLLLQRAFNDGEMTRDEVLSEKVKVRLDGFDCDETAPGWADLPEAFGDLVERTARLHSRITLLDREIYGAAEPAEEADLDGENSVKAQLSLLRTAFDNR